MSQDDIRPVLREPAFRVPRAIVFLAVTILAFQLIMQFADRPLTMALIVEMALFPARFYTENMGGLPGGLGQGVFSLVSYGFLHGGWSHCLINLVWLLAFGAPVAVGWARAVLVLSGLHRRRRSGAGFQPGEEAWLVPIIGASAGVSGMMGAAARFAFPETAGLTLQLQHSGAVSANLEVPKRRPVMMFIGVWVVINVAFGLAGPLAAGTMSANIAWQAHLGGFLPVFC